MNVKEQATKQLADLNFFLEDYETSANYYKKLTSIFKVVLWVFEVIVLE